MRTVDLIANQKNELVYLDEFVSQLHIDKKLRDAYIINVGIWSQYFRLCLTRNQPFDQKDLDRLHINLVKLTDRFSPADYPALYTALKEFEDLVKKLPQNTEAKAS